MSFRCTSKCTQDDVVYQCELVARHSPFAHHAKKIDDPNLVMIWDQDGSSMRFPEGHTDTGIGITYWAAIDSSPLRLSVKPRKRSQAAKEVFGS